MIDPAQRASPDWRWIVPITMVGLALRIASAQGALWLDEAWSALSVHEAGTPLHIFLNINHDNNHHLNSLWLLTVGWDAPPLLQRALSIACGGGAIIASALIGARRSPQVATLTALLFALSPAMVTMGSEARGYAPMMLALLVAILCVDRCLAGEKAAPRLGLAFCFFLGALSQATIVFGFCAIAGWVLMTLVQREGWRRAVVATARLLWPAALALLAVAAIVFGAAANSVSGFQFGNYVPFSLAAFTAGLAQLIGYTSGFPSSTPWELTIAVAAILVAWRERLPRLALYAFAVIGLPVMMVLLRVANPGHPRYYLLVAVALLLLMGDLLGSAIRTPGWRRWIVPSLITAFVVGSAQQDALLIRNQRGDPGVAIRTMRDYAPAGTGVALAHNTALAVMEVAAAQARYPLAMQYTACPPAPFIFTDRFWHDPIATALQRCRHRYMLIAQGHAEGMSGSNWALYQLQP